MNDWALVGVSVIAEVLTYMVDSPAEQIGREDDKGGWGLFKLDAEVIRVVAG